uniref:NADH dehydrogenase subunit 6 n=1 Tax=Prionospio multibranchiata TaxID=3050093 RepID=A0AAU6QG59_9ANNE
MLSILLFSIMSSLAATLVLTTSPIILGVWIILISFMMSMTVALNSTTWLGLMVFLIYVGGLLVMFSYFVALTPNLLMDAKTVMYAFFFSIPLFYFLYKNMPDLTSFSTKTQAPLSFLMEQNLSPILFIALVLFFALVAVVKMCSKSSSPLRPFN